MLVIVQIMGNDIKGDICFILCAFFLLYFFKISELQGVMVREANIASIPSFLDPIYFSY